MPANPTSPPPAERGSTPPAGTGRAKSRPMLRSIVRLLTGGGSYTARFVRGLVWQHRALAIGQVVSASLVGVVVMAELVAYKLVVEAFMAVDESGGAETGLAQSLAELGVVGAPLRALHERLSETGMVLALIALVVALRVASPLVAYVGKTFAIRICTRALEAMRRSLFRLFVTMRYGSISRYRVGDLVQYMNDLTPAAGQVVLYGDLVANLITVVFVIATMIWGSWQLALGVTALLVVIFVPLRAIVRRVKSASAAQIVASKRLNEHTLEFLGGLRQVHTYSREAYAEELVNAEIEKSIAAQLRGRLLAAVAAPMQRIVGAVAVGAVLVGGFVWFQESLGTVVMYVMAMQRALQLVSGVSATLARIYQKWPPTERAASILRRDDKEMAASGRERFDRLTEALEFRGVGLDYDDGTTALEDVSFRLASGRMIAFVGPSGAGKSSIVNLLLRLYEPTSGQIVADGRDLANLRTDDWRGSIGLVDQDPFVFNASVAENIRFGRLEATDDEVREAARVAHVHDVVEELPNGYDTLLGERGLRLSGGQKQRLVIARAIVRRPSLLILDEATSALDSESERLVQEAIDGVRAGNTVVAIAHRLSTIAMADEIVVLRRGCVAERGTHDELLATGGLYARLWRRQTTVPTASANGEA